MNVALRCAAGLAVLGFGSVLAAQEMLEQLGERLNFNLAQGAARVRLSGSLELEAYAATNPVADLVTGEDNMLFNPRFTFYLDAQSGEHTYVFGQIKIDRGFDVYVEDPRIEARFDEYAVRYEVYRAGRDRVFVQAGKFATIVGGWTKRHTAWENPFITAPLPYDNLTGIWDVAPVPSKEVLLAWAHVQPVGNASQVLADKRLRLPVIWGPAYARGVAVAGRWGRLEVAAEIKAVGVSSRPERWEENLGAGESPTANLRLGWSPDPSWDLGFSVSHGEYLDRQPHANIPVGASRHDYTETVLAHDLAFSWRHWQVWAEVFAAQFAVPGIGRLGTVSGFVESKYRFSPIFSLAVRWNQQFFDHVTPASGPAVRWGRETWRLDLAPAWRLTPQMQLKLQYSLRHEEPAPESYTQFLAGQLNVRF